MSENMLISTKSNKNHSKHKVYNFYYILNKYFNFIINTPLICIVTIFSLKYIIFYIQNSEKMEIMKKLDIRSYMVLYLLISLFLTHFYINMR
jgi:hypothetical protein